MYLEIAREQSNYLYTQQVFCSKIEVLKFWDLPLNLGHFFSSCIILVLSQSSLLWFPILEKCSPMHDHAPQPYTDVSSYPYGSTKKPRLAKQLLGFRHSCVAGQQKADSVGDVCMEPPKPSSLVGNDEKRASRSTLVQQVKDQRLRSLWLSS